MCEALGISLRTIQRWEAQEDVIDKRKGPNTKPAHSLTEQEKAQIIKVANSYEFSELPPSQIVPKLADKGIYIGSESSFYRVLKASKQLVRRGKQKMPSHLKPKTHIAVRPNQIWSWDQLFAHDRPRTFLLSLLFYSYL